MTEEVQDDGFAAGFDAVAGTTSPVVAPVVAAADPDPAPVADPVPDPAPVVEPDKPDKPVVEELDPKVVDAALADEPIPGFTTDQIKTLLAKAAEMDSLRTQYDKLAGHVGTVMQDVKTLKTPPKVELPKIDADKFTEDYPDIAAFNQQKIAEVQARYDELQAQLATEVASRHQQSIDFQMAMLTMAHPDWTTTVSSPDYRMWLATQPAEYQKIADETTSSVELGKVLATYKDSGKKQVQQNRNQARLEQALVPTGAAPVRPAELTETDHFKAGFAAVAGRH